MPYLTRTHQGVILLLGAALLLLWGWRSNFWLPPSPPPAAAPTPVFVEVTGAASNPGVFSFPQPPTLPEVWRAAQGPSPIPDHGPIMTSGSRLEITPDGQRRLGRMQGAQLLTLGLPIDLNRATKEDLEALPGIGPVMAKRIIDYRNANGFFGKIQELEEVLGLGPKNVEKLKPYLEITR